jgi:hypothetical protein
VELRHRCKRVDVAYLSNHGVTNVLNMRVVIISEWSTPPPNSYTHQLRLVMDLPQRTQSSQTEGRVVLAIQAFNQGHFSTFMQRLQPTVPHIRLYEDALADALRDTILDLRTSNLPLRRNQYLFNRYYLWVNEAYHLEPIAYDKWRTYYFKNDRT